MFACAPYLSLDGIEYTFKNILVEQKLIFENPDADTRRYQWSCVRRRRFQTPNFER